MQDVRNSVKIMQLFSETHKLNHSNSKGFEDDSERVTNMAKKLVFKGAIKRV